MSSIIKKMALIAFITLALLGFRSLSVSADFDDVDFETPPLPIVLE